MVRHVHVPIVIVQLANVLVKQIQTNELKLFFDFFCFVFIVVVFN